MSRAAHEANGGAKKKLASTLQLFRDLGISTANLMSGRSADEEEDPEYLKVTPFLPASMQCHLQPLPVLLLQLWVAHGRQLFVRSDDNAFLSIEAMQMQAAVCSATLRKDGTR